MKSIEVKKKVKTALSCTSMVSLVQLQPKFIYIRKKSVCMLFLSLIHY